MSDHLITPNTGDPKEGVPGKDLRVFEELFERRVGDVRPGLLRVQTAWDALQRPSSQTPSILIGGTNGKGTVSAFVFHILALAGCNVGLFTSPHLVRFRERIQTSRRTISDDDLVGILQKVREGLGAQLYEPLSFFEISTLMGLTCFELQKTDINVMEVGMGGRWDSTNILSPVASAVVSIGIDHAKWLGDTPAAIAAEKIQIARPGAPLFWGRATPRLDGAAETVLSHCAAIGAIPVVASEHFGSDGSKIWHRNFLDLPDWEAPIPAALGSLPPFLKANLALASALSRWLLAHHVSRATSWQSVWEKVGSTEAPIGPSFLGRFQRVELAIDPSPSSSPQAAATQGDVILDVCHNIDGARALGEALKNLSHGGNNSDQFPALVSILGDKDVPGILDVLKRFLGPIVLFRIANERSFKAPDLGPAHGSLEMFGTFAAAFEHMRSQYWDPAQSPLVICGSVAAVGEVIAAIDAYPDDFNFKQVLRGSWST